MSQPRLPLELFPLIFLHVEEDADIFRLASASRLFNRWALHTYFARHHEDAQPSKIRIFNTFLQPTHLQARLLSLDLAGKDVESLIYTYSAHDSWEMIIRHVEMLTRLINYLGSVKHIKLRLMASRFYTANGLREANLKLLHTLKLKNIQKVHIMASYAMCSKTIITKKPIYRVVSFGERLPVLWGGRKASVTHETQRLCMTEGAIPEPTLKHLTLNSFPSTFRSFYVELLQLNRLTLTHLKLTHIARRFKRDFATFLATIDLPVLEDLRIEVAEHKLEDPFLRFVARHPGIIRLGCLLEENGWSRRYPVYPASHLTLQPTYDNVEELVIGIRYVQHFLSPRSSMPSLSKLVLHSSSTTFSKGMEVFDKAMYALRHCQNPIQLTLSSDCVYFDLEGWFENLSLDDTDARPERVLSCVRSVRLVHECRSFSEELVGYLPVWLALFPELEEVTFWAHSEEPRRNYMFSDGTAWPVGQPKRMIGELKRLSGSIQKVEMIVGKYEDKEAWDVRGNLSAQT